MSGEAKYCPPFKGKDGQWYFHLRSGTGEIQLESEGYTTREHAEEGIEAAKRSAAEASGAAED